jgi:hypothetical protein
VPMVDSTEGRASLPGFGGAAIRKAAAIPASGLLAGPRKRRGERGRSGRGEQSSLGAGLTMLLEKPVLVALLSKIFFVLF